jgi:DNA-directed RNA polymerase subunit alpha
MVPTDRRILLRSRISNLELSVRAMNGIWNCVAGRGNWEKREAVTLRDLVKCTETDLLKTKNFGRKSLSEVRAFLAENGLSLGMTEDQIRQIEEPP